MKKLCFILSALLLASAPAFAQNDQAGAGAGSAAGAGSGSGAGLGAGQTKATTTTKTEEPSSRYPWVRTLTNVQIELTLTDQVGTAAPEKKSVSMIASSGNWGKIRSAGTYRPTGEPALVAELNVDARPFVSTDGAVQLELTVVYNPPGATRIEREDGKARPSGINQSLTVVLQSGKPLIISQAADPVSDRKVVVEVKATVLK